MPRFELGGHGTDRTPYGHTGGSQHCLMPPTVGGATVITYWHENVQTPTKDISVSAGLLLDFVAVLLLKFTIIIVFFYL